ncbi:hypothetical protein G647_10133 [Cladophialophora carrionii CBS 160.54]|uniref:Transcription factor domain-containing protein n=1 Tax=Cladophialophora carrionii CBS 160.54 TaxID=1279043 RepID=V9DJG4_9EURO|nr:uncharacterized protein G647_10133 [Cladophialophora carrionii CBS 160.54]ETI27034.1 hypothetical protein G647_10133 [Cladophialophora carrionii CBS 160.54]
MPFIDDNPASRLQWKNSSSRSRTLTRERAGETDLPPPLPPAARLRPRPTSSPFLAPAPAPAPAPPPSVLCEDVYFAYLRHELRGGDSLLDGQWPGFSALKDPDGLSRRCITCFAVSFFGRRNRDHRAREQGVRLYVDALGELNARLSLPRDSAPGQTVLAITILTAYEYLTATSPTAWIDHMLGLATFFDHHGVDVFLHERHVLTQFEGDRFSMIIAAIAARRPFRLSSDQWTTQSLPWRHARAPKPQRQYLLDLASRLPGMYLAFMEYRNPQKTSSPPAQKAELCHALESNMHDLLRGLRVWEQAWRREDAPRVEERALSEAEQRACGFTTGLVFTDVDGAAYTFVMYNIVLVILLELWKTVRGAAQVTVLPAGVDQEPPTQSLMAQARGAALDICRTLPLYRSGSGSWVDAIQVVVAVRMALVVFRQESESGNTSPRVIWLEGILRQITGESGRGWEIGKYAMQEFG